MVEENQPQRDPAEQIEPEIASGGDHRSMHRGNLACWGGLRNLYGAIAALAQAEDETAKSSFVG
jgi:hypothetical protein